MKLKINLLYTQAICYTLAITSINKPIPVVAYTVSFLVLAFILFCTKHYLSNYYAEKVPVDDMNSFYLKTTNSKMKNLIEDCIYIPVIFLVSTPIYYNSFNIDLKGNQYLMWFTLAVDVLFKAVFNFYLIYLVLQTSNKLKNMIASYNEIANSALSETISQRRIKKYQENNERSNNNEEK